MLVSVVNENNIIINIVEVNRLSENDHIYNTWDTVGEVYSAVEPLESLADSKVRKIAEFKKTRDQLETEDIEVDSMTFDYDDKSRERLRLAHEYIEEFNPTGTITWILSNNTSVELTLDNFKNIVKSVAERSSALHYKYNTLKEKVNSCTTNEEVEAILWE